MTAYEDRRDEWYLSRLLQTPIKEFITRYNANPLPNADRRTVFLFPGGMGSQLIRAKQKYQDGPPFSYKTVWLNCSVVDGVAAELQMQMHGHEDYKQQFVIPDGCVDFINLPPLIYLRPYDGFIQWCQTNWIDLFVFGWDWRRGSVATAKLFLENFLPQFDDFVENCKPHPLKNFWLIGHSFGGMVIKQIMNQSSSKYVLNMKGAITVASPFYGYGGQVHRFFKGQQPLNIFAGKNGATKMTRVISTMPGGYEVLFLDEATYNANEADFKNDPDEFNLTNYPSMDANASDERADPYNPTPDATGKVRYLSKCGFDKKLLRDGKAAFDGLTKNLDDKVAGKFWNIRGFGKRAVVSQTWARVSPKFNPDSSRDPISDTHGPGDGVLPAWSTRLLGNPNVISIDVETDHMNMMNERAVQVEIANLLATRKALKRQMRRTAKTTKMKAASRRSFNDFLRDMQNVMAQKKEPRRKVGIRKYLAKYRPRELQELFARGYLDALRSPSQIAKKSRDRGHRLRKKKL